MKANRQKGAGSAAADEALTREGGWTRQRVKRYLVQRFYTRFHMSLILSSSGFAAMLINWLLLHAGVREMWVRYPIAIGMAYLTFLAGVWLWLRYVGLGQRTSVVDSLADTGDLPNIIPSGGVSGGGGIAEVPQAFVRGGGEFGGAGAGGSWDEAPTQVMTSVRSSGGAMSSSSDSVSSIFDKMDFGALDGDAIVLIALALLLIASIFILSGYVIWFAPEILGEAAFGALLAGTLVKSAKRQDSEGWVAGVVKKTWWPFAIVFAFSLVFAIYAALKYPGATTFSQTLSMIFSQ